MYNYVSGELATAQAECVDYVVKITELEEKLSNAATNLTETATIELQGSPPPPPFSERKLWWRHDRMFSARLDESEKHRVLSDQLTQDLRGSLCTKAHLISVRRQDKTNKFTLVDDDCCFRRDCSVGTRDFWTEKFFDESFRLATRHGPCKSTRTSHGYVATSVLLFNVLSRSTLMNAVIKLDINESS